MSVPRLSRAVLLLCIGLLIFSFPVRFSSAGASASRDTSADECLKQGQEFSRRGDFEQAILREREAVRLYREQGKTAGQLEALIQLARDHQSLGQYGKSLEHLKTASDLIPEESDSARKSLVAGLMGNACIYIDSPHKAEKYLKEGITSARKGNHPEVAALILNDLGTLYTLQGKHDEALAVYREGAVLAEKADDPSLMVQLQTHLAVASLQKGNYEESERLLDSALGKAGQLAPSHDKAYGLIRIGQAYRRLGTSSFPDKGKGGVAARKALREAAEIAEEIGDHRAASYAFGYLGELDEEDRAYDEALQWTRKAIFAAQQVRAKESLYLWEWQTGRIFKAQEKTEEASAAYRTAIDTLQAVRQEMAGDCSVYNRFSFGKSVSSVYYELADLLLRHAASLQQQEMEPYLIEARETMELLKTAELRDYFEDPCVDAYQSDITRLDKIAANTAVIYAIPLPDRLELLLSLPSGMKRFVSPVGVDLLTQEGLLLRRALEKRTTWEYLPHARTLYDWLIRPLEAELASQRIDTLIFVPDAALRTIPMTTLHDGEQFLIGKFAVVTTPGLTLTDPRPLRRKDVRVLLGGLTQSVQGFPPLVNVGEEMRSIRDLYGGTVLEDQDFLIANVKEAIKQEPYSVVHLATHGEFAREVQDTYLLTWNDKLSMDQLDLFMKIGQYQRRPVELLTLSACRTAAGDDRAALGLAGVAVRAGARSALATLWYVSDEATSELVVEFYRQLQDASVSKSEALRQAQLKLLGNPRYRHPYYWSPFLLIGNWL